MARRRRTQRWRRVAWLRVGVWLNRLRSPKVPVGTGERHEMRLIRKLPYAGTNRFRFRGKLPEDRKSTRLNSSHVAISYAVFCLKKKKQVQEAVDKIIQQSSTGEI